MLTRQDSLLKRRVSADPVAVVVGLLISNIASLYEHMVATVRLEAFMGASLCIRSTWGTLTRPAGKDGESAISFELAVSEPVYDRALLFPSE
jgi:hypothetical protein